MPSGSKILSFLLAHHEFFIRHLSGAYPLSPAFIEKHKDMWGWGNLTLNEELPWSNEFFIRFDDYWIWRSEEADFIPSVIDNKAIKWNMQLLERYSEKMHWEWISQKTNLLLKFPGIFKKFKNNLFWDYISGNEFMKWSEQ